MSYFLRALKAPWKHNNIRSKLKIPVNEKTFDNKHFYLAMLSVLPAFGIMYSYYGIAN